MWHSYFSFGSCKPPGRWAAGWVWLCNSPFCWGTYDRTFLSCLMRTLSAGHSTTTPAGCSLHQPGGGSGSDRQTCPKLGGHQTATQLKTGCRVLNGIQYIAQKYLSIWQVVKHTHLGLLGYNKGIVNMTQLPTHVAAPWVHLQNKNSVSLPQLNRSGVNFFLNPTHATFTVA